MKRVEDYTVFKYIPKEEDVEHRIDSFRRTMNISNKLFGPLQHNPDIPSCLTPTHTDLAINNSIIQVLVKKIWITTQILTTYNVPYDIVVYIFLHIVCYHKRREVSHFILTNPI